MTKICAVKTRNTDDYSPPTKQHPVVLIHGIFSNAERLGTLKSEIQKADYKCLAPNLTPANGKEAIASLTTKFESYIDHHLGREKPFHLIGFSMGGIVARSYLLQSKNRQYCKSLTTIASPHHGTKTAYLSPLQAGVELRPHSKFLNSLNASPLSLHRHTLSIRTKFDGVIIPSESSTLKNASNICVYSPSHPSLIVNTRVKNFILQHLEKAESGLEI